MRKKLVIGASAILLCGVAAAYFAFAGEPQLIQNQVDEAPRPVTDLEDTKHHKFVTLDQDILEGLGHDVDTIQIQLFNGESVKIRINERQGASMTTMRLLMAWWRAMRAARWCCRWPAMPRAGMIDFSNGRSFGRWRAQAGRDRPQLL